jgi:hypothetical protein
MTLAMAEKLLDIMHKINSLLKPLPIQQRLALLDALLVELQQQRNQNLKILADK